MSTEQGKPADAPAPPAPPAPPVTGLALLRQPVEDRYIAKLPKPTKQQTEDCRTGPNGARKVDPILCQVCHSYHHPKVIHLDYVGHAATTARLLEADEQWSWEPLAFDEQGLPRLDSTGGLWIRLTVCGVTRLGYGNADVKNNADAGSRLKEVIGDAIRNAAMRFGWALSLWHKGGDLFLPSVHEDDDSDRGDSGPAADAVESQARREPARPPKVEKKPYELGKFRANLPEWIKAMKEGRATAAQIIATIESRNTLTAKQRADIKNAAPKPASNT